MESILFADDTTLFASNSNIHELYNIIYIPWLFPLEEGVADTQEELSRGGKLFILQAMTRDPAPVWTELLECHSLSSPVFHLRCILLGPLLPLLQSFTGFLVWSPAAAADAYQDCVTIVRHPFLSLARSLASLSFIPLSLSALLTPSIHFFTFKI